jgi:hypothetical protein
MTELKKAGAGFRVCFFSSVLKESSVLAGYFLVTVDSIGAEFFLYAEQLVVLGHTEPVLIWPALVATAMSAMVASSVSPERWEMTAV